MKRLFIFFGLLLITSPVYAKFNINQDVYDVINGKGKIVSISITEYSPFCFEGIIVRFTNFTANANKDERIRYERYTLDGKKNNNDLKPSLYDSPVMIEILSKPINSLNYQYCGTSTIPMDLLKQIEGKIDKVEETIDSLLKNEKFKLHQVVYDVVRGKGVIVEIKRESEICNIGVQFPNCEYKTYYYADGKYSCKDAYPSLYAEEMKIVKK